jgi:hypothetical protein
MRPYSPESIPYWSDHYRCYSIQIDMVLEMRDKVSRFNRTIKVFLICA